MNDFGYYKSIIENLEKVNATQEENIKAAGKLMADAIENDRLISVYGGGGHTTLPVGEMFFRAGGLSCINPIMETGLSVFNQALKYLELERTVNYGAAIVRYYDLKKDDLLIIFHNIGINPATIDAAMEAKKNGVKII
ncbi:MAG: SIS domain-containing protein, partial [Clostridia bacterium]|nr:SIS domain-containing protein [Clostridia bacterium]